MARPKKPINPANHNAEHTKQLNELVVALNSNPYVLAVKNNTGAAKFGKHFVRFGKKGMPDIYGLLRGGYFFALEMKTGSGVLTPDQVDKIAHIQKLGGLVAVVKNASEGIGCVTEWMQKKEAAYAQMEGYDANGSPVSA